ncbi:MAG: hypothetical protein IKJ72_03020, partial [Mycoplasmataceae bacterium]|nr:hypothetical protein [Mycoplasmataceae bacterium]
NLLVNDYVIIAIRVKKEFLISESNSKGYLIKEDPSYLPIQSRVYGYKIKTSEIKIDLDSIKLENVGQADSASYALDGYARLKNLSLIEDQDKNYLGASIKINYFNDFYKKDNKILVSGSGQVLVKRQTGTSSKDYKDTNGNPIVDGNNNAIKLELDSDSKPNKLIENSTSTRNTILEEYSPGVFRFSSSIISSELQYNFFQNQKIEFEFVNKKGKATKDEEYDYYVDNSENKIQYTFENIKFPINNDSNIRYEFNSKEFIETISNPNNIKNVYQNSLDPSKEPINGQSKIKKLFSITRKENNKENQIFSTLDSINNILEQDFKGQIKLVATHSSVDGKTTTINNGDITTINNLKNGDRFKIEIVSTSNDLIFAQQPSPLIFVVSGLYDKPIDQELLKYLRVKQGGTVDGQGSFNILVDDPKQSNSDSDLNTLLGGYKFLVRVWDKDKNIKHEWTENFISINNLNNGDKVEWKLVSPNGSPLKPSYYNTIANPDKHNANEKIY